MLNASYSDLFSLFGIFLGVQALWQLSKNGSRIGQDSVTSEDQNLALRLALFVGVPLGVLLHEWGHSLATWQLGGTVENFQWRYMWGYIIPSGAFSLAGKWWISLSGNLVSILLGLLPLLWVSRIRHRFWAEVVYQFIFIQLVYALILYPLMSLLSQQGDWAFIYNIYFLTQLYGLLTLIAHGALLWSLRQLYHSRRVMRWRLARQPLVLENWNNLEAKVALEPENLQNRLNLLYFLVNAQESHEAKRIYRQVRRMAGDDVRAKVAQVALAYSRRAYGQAIRTGRRLLSADLSSEDQLRLYRLLSYSLYNLRRTSEALTYANQGVEADPRDYRIRCMRAQIYRAMNRQLDAKADLEVALVSAPDEESRLWVKQILSGLT
jgi:tetratricopeptide (TPR) repeat protein